MLLKLFGCTLGCCLAALVWQCSFESLFMGLLFGTSLARVLMYWDADRDPVIPYRIKQQRKITQLQAFFRSSEDIKKHLKDLAIDDEVRDHIKRCSTELYVSLIFLELMYQRLLSHMGTRWDYVDKPYAHEQFLDMIMACLDVIQGLNVTTVAMKKAYREVLFFYKLFVLKTRPKNYLRILNSLTSIQSNMDKVRVSVSGENLYSVLQSVSA